MSRAEQAVLAFIGNAEVDKAPLSAMANMATDHDKIQISHLIHENMVEIVAGRLFVTMQGWHFLDTRPSE